MNGLTYIRIRCNISQSEPEDILQVSKQVISLREDDKKETSLGGNEVYCFFQRMGDILVLNTEAYPVGQ